MSEINLFKHRNLALGCCSFLIALYFSFDLSLFVSIALIISFSLLLSVFTVMFVISKKNKIKKFLIKPIIMTVFILLAIGFSLLSFSNDKQALDLCDGREYKIVGKVNRVISAQSFSGRYVLDVSSVNDAKTSITVILNDETGELNENDIVTAFVYFEPLNKTALGFSESDAYLNSGILVNAYNTLYSSIEKGDNDLIDHLKGLNRFLDGILKKHLNTETYEMMSALFLGNRSDLDDDLNRDFSRLGIIHVVSLSGMHITIIITIIGFSVSKLRMRKQLKLSIIIFLIILFVAVTGFIDTALRAGFMQIIFYLLLFSNEHPDTITTLFVSIFVIVLIFPFSVFSYSLLLSFLAMLGCLCSGAFINKKNLLSGIRWSFLRNALLTFITTAFVVALSLPFTAEKFGVLSLVSAPANIFICPFFDLLIYLCPVLLILSPIPYVSDAIVWICEASTSISISICSYFSQFEYIIIPICTVVQFIGIIIIFFAFVWFLCTSKKKIKYSIFFLIVGIAVFAFGTVYLYIDRGNNAYITPVTIGKSDTVFIEHNNDLTIIDSTDFSTKYVTPCLYYSHLGYTEIENYVACSYGKSMVRYIDSITNNVIVRNVYLMETLTDEEEAQKNEVVNLLKKKNINVYFITDTSARIGKLNVEFCKDYYYNSTVKKRTVAYTVLINNTRFTYLGASPYRLLDNYPDIYVPCSDIVFFGSYGPGFNNIYSYDIKNLDYCFFTDYSVQYAREGFYNKINLKSFADGETKIRIS